jgi:hypothetical protein
MLASSMYLTIAKKNTNLGIRNFVAYPYIQSLNQVSSIPVVLLEFRYLCYQHLPILHV